MTDPKPLMIKIATVCVPQIHPVVGTPVIAVSCGVCGWAEVFGTFDRAMQASNEHRSTRNV